MKVFESQQFLVMTFKGMWIDGPSLSVNFPVNNTLFYTFLIVWYEKN